MSNESLVDLPSPSDADGIPSTTDLGFYRSPVRVALCCLVAAPGYLTWWAFQLVRFGQREGMPHVTSPWFLLMPFYNLLLLFYVIDGIQEAEAARHLTALRVAPVAAAGLTAGWINQQTARPQSLEYGLHLLVRCVYVAIVYTVQAHANALQAAQSPGVDGVPSLSTNVSRGEVIAILLGLLLTLTLVTGWAKLTIG